MKNKLSQNEKFFIEWIIPARIVMEHELHRAIMVCRIRQWGHTDNHRFQMKTESVFLFDNLGPMQPFLAYNLQTDTQTINLVWTLGFLGCLIGSLITSHIFTKYLKTSLRKMMFMSFVMFLTGLATLCIPFMMNLPLLLIARFVQVQITKQNIII